MKRSIEDIIKLVAVKQAVPPPPTRLEKPGAEKEAPIGAMSTLCGVTYPAKYDLGVVVGHGSVREIYRDIIPWMYCRNRPEDGRCEALYINEDEGSKQIVTTRDQPLTWQRQHPEFNPDDPSTWGSVFGPNGFVERMIRSYHCGRDENNNLVNCPSNADINEMVDIIRRLYAVKCMFLVAQTGACCSPDGDFGGFRCSEVGAPAECVGGIFHAGKTCAELGGDNCALAANLKMAQDKITTEKQIMDTVMSILKVR